MSYFKYLKKYWKLIVMNSVVHIYQRFYSIPLWCSWKVVQNLPGRFCDKRSVWQCHMIAWWTEKKPQIFLTTLYMGSLSMAFILYWFKLNVYRHVTGLVDNISLRGKSELFKLCPKHWLFQLLCFCFDLWRQLFWRRST